MGGARSVPLASPRADQVIACYIFEEHAPRELVESIGVDNVLFETDFPHPVCLYDNVRQKIDAALGDAPAETRSKILFDNAAKLYKFDAPDVPPPVLIG